MWLTPQEQRTLTILALIGLVGLGMLLWQRRTPPLTIAGASASPGAVQWSTALEASRRIDVNTAAAAELERLPEVGPSLARRIVEYRQVRGRFGSPEELLRVPGIGPKTYEALKDYVTAQ